MLQAAKLVLLKLTLCTPAEGMPASNKLKALGTSCPKGHVSLQLAAQLAGSGQELGRNWLQVDVALTDVLEAKLEAKEMGGKSPGEVTPLPC